jgi:hypothetical protein
VPVASDPSMTDLPGVLPHRLGEGAFDYRRQVPVGVPAFFGGGSNTFSYLLESTNRVVASSRCHESDPQLTGQFQGTVEVGGPLDQSRPSLCEAGLPGRVARMLNQDRDVNSSVNGCR